MLSGGSLSKVTIGGGVDMLATGTATSGYAYDLGGGTGFGQGVLDPYVPDARESGGNISHVQLGLVNMIAAGDGAPGKHGGSLQNITITSDLNGFVLQAGDGGDGDLTKANGGHGGKVSNVVVFGLPDAALDDTIQINAGAGGDGFGTGRGGNGGNVDKVYVGYEFFGKQLRPSDNFLSDFVYVEAGDGGDGKIGGKGGNASDINIRTAPSDSAVGPEIAIAAGNGGDTTDTKGKSGDGGSVSKFYVISNFDDPGALPGLEVTGGMAGDAFGKANSGKGGSVSDGTILARAIQISGGDGSDADRKGGDGGSIHKIHIAFPGDAALTQFGQPVSNLGNVFAEQVALIAGNGGDSLDKGNGGKGGHISNVAAPDTDLSLLFINGLLGGNGGMATDGRGGNGGSLHNITFDSDRETLSEVSAIAASGDGGDGSKKGGAGGDITSSVFILTDAELMMSAGFGGSSSDKVGGNGGSIRNTTLVVTGEVVGSPGGIVVMAGDGGDGGKKAGNGGAIDRTSAIAPGDVLMGSGFGGDSKTGKTGVGGNVSNVVLSAFLPGSSAALFAGDAGTGISPSKGGHGGSIVTANIFAAEKAMVVAGSGQFGGNGGDIRNVSISSSLGMFNEEILVAAGAGGDSDKKAGRGGSLQNIVADIGKAGVDQSVFTAGIGGDSDKRPGDGGSVSGLTILSGESELVVSAGNGGESNAKGNGGKGGNVADVSILPGDVILQAAIAGDGGDSKFGKGGNGGSITNVNSLGDIGIRSGVAFGVNDMGGLFAGAPGQGGKADGKPGDVIDITAQAISSIVAGTEATPQLVGKVDGIFLRGINNLEPVPSGPSQGSFFDPLDPNNPNNIFNANFVGGISDPLDPDASEFLTNNGRLTDPVNPWNANTDEPIDGLIAALVLTDRRNVAPNAWLQQDANGNQQLVSLFNT